MIVTAPPRTPGLYFETHAPELREVLPRLDIAAFIGFTASGPLDVPVPVEDPASFEELFGADFAPGALGRQLRTQLAPTVRAFFRNGGRRCWVVRVARDPIANDFVLPGVLRMQRARAPSAWVPATARARSEGSWSDSIAVNTTLTVTPLPRGALTIGEITSPPEVTSPSGEQAFSLAIETGRTTVQAGELLRINIPGSTLMAFVTVPEELLPGLDGRIAIPWSHAIWLEEADAEPWPFDGEHIVAARQVLPAGIHEPVQIVEASRRDGTLGLVVTKDEGRLLREGSWVEIDVHTSGEARRAWVLQVDHASPSASTVGSPPAAAAQKIEARRAWRFVEPPSNLQPGVALEVNALTFEAWTRDAGGRSARLADLGFAKGHARYWGDLPTDTDLFSSPEQRLASQRLLAREASHPRFPLAGVEPDCGAPAVVFLPLGIPPVLRSELEQHAEPRSESRLKRDGLERIGADLFLDDKLREASFDDLVEQAFRVRYSDDGSGRSLRGLHALIHLDEISLIGAPDALLHGSIDVAAPAVLPEVTLSAVPDAADPGFRWLVWPAVNSEVAYTLQQSDTADFVSPTSHHLNPDKPEDLVTNDPVGQCKRRVALPRGMCASSRWYRVRVEGPSGGGLWSNTVRLRPAAATFDPCEQIGVEAPSLSVTRSTGHVVFAWTNTGSMRYRLESAVEPTFAAAQLLFDGSGLTFSMLAPLELKYVRVRAQTQPAGAWSNSVRVAPDAEVARPEAERVNVDPNMALEVNAGLLTFCAARGDVFAVLGAPMALTDEEVIEHKTQLVEPFLSRGDRRTPSFGGLYYPWLVVAQDGAANAELQTMVPVGAICGLIAARTLAHGAWFAPANRRLIGVVSRSTAVDRTSWAKLNAAHVNAVWLEPRGYVTLGARTLTPEGDLREISARRLLILLHRLVLREGPSLVFEPNGPDLRRAVRRQFEGLLGSLFVRGALAGRTPAEAFQVGVDDTINTPQSVDLGRLIVELRVAPSRPLAFLIVRFVLSGGGTAAVEGA